MLEGNIFFSPGACHTSGNVMLEKLRRSRKGEAGKARRLSAPEGQPHLASWTIYSDHPSRRESVSFQRESASMKSDRVVAYRIMRLRLVSVPYFDFWSLVLIGDVPLVAFSEGVYSRVNTSDLLSRFGTDLDAMSSPNLTDAFSIII